MKPLLRMHENGWSDAGKPIPAWAQEKPRERFFCQSIRYELG